VVERSFRFGDDRAGSGAFNLLHGGFLHCPEFFGKFQHTFHPGISIVRPMVDIKSMLMFTHVFKPRAVLYLLLIPLVLTIMISVSLNYFWI
jgi:hypothetical protein